MLFYPGNTFTSLIILFMVRSQIKYCLFGLKAKTLAL